MLQTPSLDPVLMAPMEHPLTLWQTFGEMVQTLDISQKYCIRQPGCRDYELSAEMIERLQTLSPDVQQRSWIYQLRSYLYGTVYNGSLRKVLAADQPAEPIISVENDSFMGVDLQFYQRLHNSNAGEGYFDPGWQVIDQGEAGILKVKKRDLTLRIDRDRHLPSDVMGPQVGDEVAIRMPKNLVQNGFYMAVGNAGSDRPSLSTQDRSKGHGTLVRIYFNLTTNGAIALMDQLTAYLNQRCIPFSFKALYNPEDYGRHDSAVLYFNKIDFPSVRDVLQEIYPSQSSQFREDIPLFTKRLAPGLGCAEETDFKFGAQESFGLNRCHIVALGLIAGQKLETTRAKQEAIVQAFRDYDLDWQRPYLNAGSEDLYQPLNLY
ncbi:T3SS effector HopA1 family protein [Lyngbya confervoides]|uniref:T3SS effector HopA1 family protein n=1 Tax=Lyngbya confervoides BDU141951 TaxID=1574623 RepID=A0ABD4T4L4_9CYAN|nr:T3SS effector HopA1 family protein [Lyngbya confervoides]MCM1983596.1 T3SS effector HopA1 family protein [Lyngbya confervoides BDU141951]